MSIVRSPVRSVVRSPVRGVLGGGVTLLGQATAYLAGVEPYHWFDFINDRCLYASNDVGGVSGATGYSFARASQGYYTNADGTLTSFASGALRRGNRGVLIEGARTNLCLQSQTFGTTWTTSNATVTADQIAAPDGTTTGDLITADGTSNAHGIVQTLTGTAAAHTYTVFAKMGTQRYIQLRFSAGLGSGVAANFDLQAGTATNTATAPTSSSIQAMGNGWYRCVMTATLLAASGQVQILAVTGTGAASNEANTLATNFYLWGAQLEAASFPSSYIPTTTASATRAADVLTCTAGVSYPLSLWAEFERAVDTGAIETVFYADDGDATDRTWMLVSSASDLASALTTAANVAQCSLSVAGALDIGTTYKMAMRVATNSVQLAKGGALATEDTSATNPANPTRLVFASRGDSELFGYLCRAAVIQGGLSNANLQSVTT